VGSNAARRAGAVLALCSVVAACAAGPPRHATDAPPPPRVLERVPAVPDVNVRGEVPAGLLDRIVHDAAHRAGVSDGDVTVLRAEAVTWPDGALGCPRPGQVYTQALVPGYRVALEAAGNRLDYHADDRGRFVLCAPSPNPQPGYPGRPPR